MCMMQNFGEENFSELQEMFYYSNFSSMVLLIYFHFKHQEQQ